MYRFLLVSLTFIASGVFAFELHNIDGDWRRTAIDEELAHFKKGELSQQMIQEYPQANDPLLFLYTIKDNILTAHSSINGPLKIRGDVIEMALNNILNITQLPDMSFLVHLGDAYTSRAEKHNIPVFVFSKLVSQNNVIVMPDFEMFSVDLDLWQPVLEYSTTFDWDSKASIAFWRGSTTSGDYSLSTWRNHPRSKLILHTSQSAIVNAAFTNYVQGAENNNDFLHCMGRCKPAVPIKKHLIFKYLIDIDGNASTYSR